MIEESPAFKVFDQGGARLVHFLTNFLKSFFKVGTGTAVVVPVGVIKLDKAHAAFN
jgi:hypothetical protein